MRSSLRAYRSAHEAILLNSRDYNRFLGHFKKLVSLSNNSIKLRTNDVETNDSIFVSDALNTSFASYFYRNIYTSDIIANPIPSFTGFPLSLADIR